MCTFLLPSVISAFKVIGANFVGCCWAVTAWRVMRNLSVIFLNFTCWLSCLERFCSYSVQPCGESLFICKAVTSRWGHLNNSYQLCLIEVYLYPFCIFEWGIHLYCLFVPRCSTLDRVESGFFHLCWYLCTFTCFNKMKSKSLTKRWMSLAPCSSAVMMYKQHKDPLLASRDCCRSLKLDCSQFLPCSSRTGGLSGRGGRAGCVSPPQPAVSSPGIHADFPSSQPPMSEHICQARLGRGHGSPACPSAGSLRHRGGRAAGSRAAQARLAKRQWKSGALTEEQSWPQNSAAGYLEPHATRCGDAGTSWHAAQTVRGQRQAVRVAGWLLQAAPFLPDRQSLEVTRVTTMVWNIPSAFQQPTLTNQL